MHLTPSMAEAFGDWLELDRIQSALVDARPDLDGAFVLDAERPLLQTQRAGGGALLVARAVEGSAGRWIVGIPGRPDPELHEVDTQAEVVEIVLETLERSSTPTTKDTAAEGQG
ncbi:MAG: hypothetical protein L0J84_14720 [Brachybacterium sp.]|nr:hypothetical protein [Brachybacterium sp.]